jgi:hypothetical protein
MAWRLPGEYGGVEMFDLKASYCSKRDCPNIKCDRNIQNIQRDKLPDWVIVTMRDFAGMFDCCTKEVQEDGSDDPKH